MRQLRQIKQAGWAACIIAMVLCSAGCEMDSYFDQSNLGSFEATPRVQPILESVSIIEGEGDAYMPTDRVRESDLIPETREYVIGPGDTLLVTVYELRVPGVDDQQQRRVTETGEVRLAIVGPIVAAGRSPSQLEKDIAQKLDEDNKLRNATVSVQVVDSRQNTYSVFSQSAQGGTTSGTYVIPKPDFRIIEALSTARGIDGSTQRLYVIRTAALDPSVTGDFPSPSDVPQDRNQPPAPDDPGGLLEGIEQGLDDAGPESQRIEPPTGVEQSLDPPEQAGQWVYVDGKWVRVESPQDTSSFQESDGQGEDSEIASELGKLVTQRIIEIPYQQLKRGDMRYNIVIRPGDIISVPDPNAGFIYAMGDIARPGAYTVPGEQELTLFRLVASAGGLAGTAWPDRVDLIRQISETEQAIVRLNLRAIANGSQPDIYLKQNDVINVGTSGVAVPLAIFRNGLRFTFGFGLVLDRNFSDEIFGER